MSKVGRGTAYALALAATSVALSGCVQISQPDSSPETSQQEQPKQGQQTPPGQGVDQGADQGPSTETGPAPPKGVDEDTATEETREAGHPTFEDGQAVSGEASPCTASVLNADFSSYKDPNGSPQNGPEGNEHGSITMTNVSSEPCWIDGYGNLQLVGDTGAVQMQQSYGLNPKPSRVLLQPNQYAAIYLTWYNVSAVGPCTSVQRVDVGLPNAPENPEEASDLQPVSAKTIDGKVFACGGQVNSSAVYKP